MRLLKMFWFSKHQYIQPREAITVYSINAHFAFLFHYEAAFNLCKKVR